MDKHRLCGFFGRSGGKLMGLYEEFKDDAVVESTFEEWNVRDLLGHISFWWDYALMKLDSMKNKKPFNEIKNIEKKNQKIYEDNKNVPIETIIAHLKNIYMPMAWEKKSVVNQYIPFTNKQLLSKDYPTGFPFELWRYIAREFFIHPYMHILHYYLKKGIYGKFTEMAVSAETSFMECSDGDMSVFSFKDYYADDTAKAAVFSKLEEHNKNIDNGLIQKIIEINVHDIQPL